MSHFETKSVSKCYTFGLRLAPARAMEARRRRGGQSSPDRGGIRSRRSHGLVQLRLWAACIKMIQLSDGTRSQLLRTTRQRGKLNESAAVIRETVTLKSGFLFAKIALFGLYY